MLLSDTVSKDFQCNFDFTDENSNVIVNDDILILDLDASIVVVGENTPIVDNVDEVLNNENGDNIVEEIVVDQPPERFVARKRAKNMSKQAKAKYALDRGLEHQNVKGKVIKARAMGAGCQNCRFKCYDKITDAQRQREFTGFWAMGDKDRQMDYVKDHILRSDPAVHKSQEKQKQNSIKYFLIIDGKMIFVCKKMFLDTFNVSESWVRTVLKKLKGGNLGHTIPGDMRGRHSKVPPEVMKKNIDNIKEHINMFKRVPSHFCRSTTKRKYLDRRLNVRKMWRFYKDWMSTSKPTDAIKSEKYYRFIFNTQFNLGFQRPKKDLCDLCVVFELCSPAQREKMQQKYDEHISNKEKAKASKAADTLFAKANKDSVCYAIFDLQKVLNVPKIDASMAYYLRKLAMYNLTIYDVIQHKGFCYVWDESNAARGANEIATCVLKFIDMIVLATQIREFIFRSDNCFGQNKNKFLFAMYTYACSKYQIRIVHRYMEKGHTMNEADSMHAAIERASKYEDVFEPADWKRIIKECKVEGKPYEVYEVGGDILDFHRLANDCQNWNNRSAKWSSVREIEVDCTKPGRVFLKHDLSQAEAKEIKITKVGRPFNLSNLEFSKAFNEPRVLKQNKLKDLAKMCNELVIPATKHGFYRGLRNFPDLDNPLLEIEEEDENGEEEEENNFESGWEKDSEAESDDFEAEAINLRRAARQNVSNKPLSEDEGGDSAIEGFEGHEDEASEDDEDPDWNLE